MKRTTTGRTVRRIGGVWSIIVVTASSASSFAQQEPGPPPEGAPSVNPGAPPPTAPMPPPPPAPLPPPPVVQSAPPEIDRGPSDFNPDLRRWAIGYAGISQVPVATGFTLTVPAVGIRYWASPTVGLDVALGIGWTGGSMDPGTGTSMDKDSVTGVVVQAGVPFALATHRHVSFQLIPMVAFARGSTSAGTGATAIDVNGTRFDVGARAGFELFFGFLGIPELALSATIGVQFEYLNLSQSAGGVTASDTTLQFSTTVQNNPWDIFTGAVSARYYF